MTTLNTFDPNTHIQTITVVGLGGTGAQIARSVARIVYDMKVARLHTPQIVLIDPDRVEQKNVGRQLYVEADVGQPKAHILMRRFNMALGLDIIGIAGLVNAEKHFERWAISLSGQWITTWRGVNWQKPTAQSGWMQGITSMLVR